MRSPSSLFYCCLTSVIFLFSQNSFSQLIVNSSVTPAQLVQAFVGAGLTVTNITMNCPVNAYGTFNGSSSNIGMANGALLTSGDVINAVGPNTIPSATTCNGNIVFDPELLAIEPTASEDVCILEFDIVPECSTLTINFVFGSEEYPEFVNSFFNDAFGFFITGPGPACQPNFYANTNVATLPDNVTPVSIDNVNNITNSTYYFDNTGGATVQYDGFTVVLTRVVSLCPCQSYHFKIAIADAGDCAYDSGVFLDFMQCQNALTTTTSTTPAGCTCNGTATVTPAGGNPPYTYNWAPSGGTNATATGLCPGTYTCTIDDAGTCTNPITATVIVTGGAVSLTSSQTNPVCNGGTGSATVTASGGTAPYTYNWTPSGGTNATATGLAAGTYTVTVTDAGGCTSTQVFTITQPTALSVTPGPVTNPTCGNSNGSASVTVSGGTSPYTYLWTPSGGTNSSATGLGAGSYIVTITDANGCTSTQSFTLTTSSGLSVSISSTTNVLCNGGTNGSATASPTGGTSPYTYAWSNSQTTATATGLGAGTYTVTVTDASGCSTTQIVSITQPTIISGVMSMNPVLCSGGNSGSAAVNASGGTPGYTYNWAPSGGTNATATGLASGVYTVTITDVNGCTQTATINVTQPTALTVSITPTNSTCNLANGSATANPSGGTGPFTYLWSPSGGTNATENGLSAGTYTVVVTDANGCTNSSTVTLTTTTVSLTVTGAITICIGQTATLTATGSGGNAPYTYNWQPGNLSGASVTVSPVTTTTYTVIVTDANGCTGSQTVTVTVNPPLSVTASANVSVCIGSSTTITANASGGNGNFTYTWAPSGTGSSITVTPTSTTTYTVTVTDNCGTPFATATVTVTVNPLPSACMAVSDTAGCAPYCVTFSECGVLGSTFAWNFTGGTPAASALQNPGLVCFNTPGFYTVSLTTTSAAGCTSTNTMVNLIHVYAAPQAQFTTGGTLFNGVPQNICMNNTSTNSTSWSWTTSTGTSTSQNPCFTYPDSGTYCVTLVASNSTGCSDSTIQCFTIIEDNFVLIIPNVFSPNGDNFNDLFTITHEGVKELSINIYNRWGNKIYENDALTQSWDGKMKSGKPAADGTYYFVLAGLKSNGELIDLKGYLTLLSIK